jgi:hypothetical protein
LVFGFVVVGVSSPFLSPVLLVPRWLHLFEL